MKGFSPPVEYSLQQLIIKEINPFEQRISATEDTLKTCFSIFKTFSALTESIVKTINY
jgi:hypothetical protein